MQSYSSAVDGKTLIRVGGGQRSKAKALQSSGTLHTAKSDLGMSMTSSRRPSVTSSSSVNITSSTISIGDASVPSAWSTSGSVTVKTANPHKKMTSIIDTKSGVVTSSFATIDPMTSSSAGMTSPRIVSSSPMISYGPMTSMDDVTMALPNRNASISSAKSTSILLTSTTIPETSRDAEETSNPMTSSIPMMMTSAAPKLASSLLIPSMPRTPSTSHVAMPAPSDPRSLGVVVATAEVHTPQTGDDSTDFRHDLDNEDRLSSVSLPYSARSKFVTPSESYADETGSLVFTDEIDSQIYEGNNNVTDGVQLSVTDATQERSPTLPNKKICDPGSNSSSSPPLSSPPSCLPSLNPAFDPHITAPRSIAGSLTGATVPDEEYNTATGSESVRQDEPETNPASTFNFIGWDVGNMADKMADRKCHRVLIFKDSEIVLMFKASCVSEEAGKTGRLRLLMIDVAINCAKRLKMMKDVVALPKLQAEHMDTLPLTDERTTKQHLDEISRELNENVMINEIAFRFQPPDEDTYIGTYIDGNDVQSTGANCQIGRSGAVVVLKKKSRFGTVESFSHQLCLHILSARPSSLGQISDLEVRRIHSTKTQLDPDKRQLLLFQDFLSDPSIIVAEAARRCFVRIEGYLFFG